MAKPESPDPRGESQPPITAQRRSAAFEGVHPTGAPPIDPGPRRQQGFIHDQRWIQATRGFIQDHRRARADLRDASARTTPRISLATVDAVLRDAVALVASTDPNPTDPFRGLYISDDAAVDAAAGLDGAEVDSRLDELARALGLDALDCELLALCAAPELDPRYGRLVAYLHDDVTRRRPSPRLLARLLGGPGATAGDRARAPVRGRAAARAAAPSACSSPSRRSPSPSARSPSTSCSSHICSARSSPP